jgi:hypothetical protein
MSASFVPILTLKQAKIVRNADKPKKVTKVLSLATSYSDLFLQPWESEKQIE